MGSINMKDILEKALDEQDYLMHHGILGQKWGVRRYQHKDGSLTEEGRKHYGVSGYQNEDWSLTEAGRKKYLKEGSKERKKFDKVAEKYAEVGEQYGNLWNKLHERGNYKERYRILRKLDAYKDMSDEELYKKISDRGSRLTWDPPGDKFWDDGVEQYIKETNPKLYNDYKKLKKEYDEQLTDLYNSVKDKTFRKLDVNWYESPYSRLFEGKDRFEMLYWNDRKRSKRNHNKSNS